MSNWLIRVWIVLAVGLVGADAAAQTNDIYWRKSGLSLPLFTDQDGACRSIAGTSYSHFTTLTSTTARCWRKTGTPPNETLTHAGDISQRVMSPCPPGEVRDLTTGTCSPAPKCVKNGQETFLGLPIGYPGSQKVPKCSGPCEVTIDAVIKVYRYPAASDPNMNYGDFLGEKTGGECSTSEQGNVGAGGPDGQERTDGAMQGDLDGDGSGGGTCPEGTTQGGVDSSGIPICMGNGIEPNQPTQTPTKTQEAAQTTTNPDGSSTVTQVTKQANADGSTTTTTTTTTTNADGSVTTNTNTVVGDTPSGMTGRHDRDPADEKYDMCKLHPELTVCKNSTVTGACEQTACTGDAIQCATLRAAAAMECRDRMNQEELKNSSLFSLGQSAIAGTDQEGLPTIENASLVNVPSTLDQSAFIGAGSCFADKTISVQGRSIVIPFSKACDILLVLRFAIMVVGSLVSFRILSGAVLKE